MLDSRAGARNPENAAESSANQTSPGPPAWLPIAGILLIAIAGMWRWRRWAFLLAIGMTPVVVVIDMTAGGPLRHMVAGSISGLLIWGLGRPLWARFR